MTLLLEDIEVEDSSVAWRQFAYKAVYDIYWDILHFGLCNVLDHSVCANPAGLAL